MDDNQETVRLRQWKTEAYQFRGSSMELKMAIFGNNQNGFEVAIRFVKNGRILETKHRHFDSFIEAEENFWDQWNRKVGWIRFFGSIWRRNGAQRIVSNQQRSNTEKPTAQKPNTIEHDTAPSVDQSPKHSSRSTQLNPETTVTNARDELQTSLDTTSAGSFPAQPSRSVAEQPSSEVPTPEKSWAERLESDIIDQFRPGIEGAGKLKEDLERYVDESGNPYLAAAAATALDAAVIAMDFTQAIPLGLLDVRRIGEGIKKGTWQGVKEDAERVLSVIPQGRVLKAIDTALTVDTVVDELQRGDYGVAAVQSSTAILTKLNTKTRRLKKGNKKKGNKSSQTYLSTGTQTNRKLSPKELHRIEIQKAIDEFLENGGEIKKIHSQPHRHHLLPREFEAKFKQAGLDIEKFKILLSPKVHLKHVHGGAAKGGLWNQTWKEFFDRTPQATAQQITDQLSQMRKSFGI